MRISDYSIVDIFAAAGVKTWRSGNQTVCRCPVCKGDDRQAGHNAQVNTESNTLFCHSGCGTFTRTRLIDEFNLRAQLDIPEYIENYKPAAEQEPAGIKDMAEIEQLLSFEIPAVLWDKNAESFLNIGLTKYAGKNRLYFILPGGTTITRNSGSIKWKWQGKQPIFNRITCKKLIFFASGVAEYLILDWAGLDYIVLPSDSLKSRISGFRERLKDKAVVILPDHDEKGSFGGVIKTIKENASRVHVCDFYTDHDFRDYARRTASNFADKQEFIDALKLNIFAELGGSESADNVTDDDIYNLIPAVEILTETAETEPEQDYSQYLISNLVKNIKPIDDIRVMGLKLQFQSIFGIVGATSAGKTDTLLQLMQEHANINNHISLYLYYEGLPNEIGIRAEKKKITGNNIYAIGNLLDFKELEKFIETFKGQKILIATDYYQSLAWNLYLNDKDKKNAAIREYTMQIFIEQDKIRRKYENVVFCNTYAVNNAAITQSGNEQSVHPFNVLNGAKEDGYIQFQVDYAYVIMFSNDKKQWKLSRYDENGKIREYIKIASAKPARVGIDSGNPIYKWENGRFILGNQNYQDNNYDKNKQNQFRNIGKQDNTDMEVW